MISCSLGHLATLPFTYAKTTGGKEGRKGGWKGGREEGTIGSDFINAYVTVRQVSGHLHV